jgi:hypothetical protein
MASGGVALETALESKFGLMVQSILESGERTVLMVKVNSCTWMETFMMGIGPMIKPMVPVSIST